MTLDCRKLVAKSLNVGLIYIIALGAADLSRIVAAEGVTRAFIIERALISVEVNVRAMAERDPDHLLITVHKAASVALAIILVANAVSFLFSG